MISRLYRENRVANFSRLFLKIEQAAFLRSVHSRPLDGLNYGGRRIYGLNTLYVFRGDQPKRNFCYFRGVYTSWYRPIEYREVKVSCPKVK